MTTITLPDGYAYVGAALVSTIFLLSAQSLLVGRYRKRAGIPYPQLYAETAQAKASKEAHLFNCAQRAHQNTLEFLPIIQTSTIVVGLKYPIFAALACAGFTVSRIFYTLGYITGEPSKRVGLLYRIFAPALIGLLLTSGYIAGHGWLVLYVAGIIITYHLITENE